MVGVCLKYLYIFIVDRNHPGIVGQDNANIPRVVSIIAETLHRELLQEGTELYLRLLSIVKQVQVGLLKYFYIVSFF